ncbi:MAG: helix-turn-helix transcriptional regulator [Thermoanaerobacteraceae bacterium]
MVDIQLTNRQHIIIDIVKKNQPITSEQIAEKLNLTRATLRPDLAILTMSGILEAKPKVGYFYTGKSAMSILEDYIKSIKVGDIKSLPVVIQESTSVYDAIVTLFLEDVGTIFVQDGGFLTGAISRKDFLKIAIGNTDIYKVPVGIIMTRMPNIVTTTDDESVYTAASKIIEHEVDSLPVVETIADITGKEGYKITGRISKTNITRLFVRLGDG